MTIIGINAFPKLDQLPTSFPIEGAVRIEVEGGVPIFRASTLVLTRIEALLEKERVDTLTEEEAGELDRYEAVDDYLSFLNRLVRNQLSDVVYPHHPPSQG